MNVAAEASGFISELGKIVSSSLSCKKTVNRKAGIRTSDLQVLCSDLTGSRLQFSKFSQAGGRTRDFYDYFSPLNSTLVDSDSSKLTTEKLHYYRALG